MSFRRGLRLSISLALLGWLACQLDWPQFARSFAGTRPGPLLAATLLILATQVLSAVRWQALTRSLGFTQPARRVMGLAFIGMYFNLLLPTSVGGDVVRAWYLAGQSGGGRLRALASVFLDRLCGLWVLLALACLGVLFSPTPVPDWVAWSVWGCAAGGLAGSLLLPVLGRYDGPAPAWLQRVLRGVRSFPPAQRLVWPVALSVAVQVGNVAAVWLVGVAIGAAVPGSYYWVLVPLVSLLTLLPVSVNGMGVREGGTVLLLAPLGVPAGVAVTLALLWFAIAAAVNLLGGLVYLFGRFPRPAIPGDSDVGRAEDGPVGGDPDQGRDGQLEAAA